MPNAIPSAQVSDQAPTCWLGHHALGIQIKQHDIQNSLLASSGSGTMHVSQQTQPLNSVQVLFTI